jgi:CheY-like chemotaxis protein
MSFPEVEILLVEDSAADAEIALHALRRENLANDVHVATDGQEALDYIFGPRGIASREGPGAAPRLVLLDLNLPKVNGLEVLRRIKADPGTCMIPVVVLTSSKEERDLVESYRLGVNSFIQKPVDFNQFRNTVRKFGFYWLVVNKVPGALAPELTQ